MIMTRLSERTVHDLVWQSIVMHRHCVGIVGTTPRLQQTICAEHSHLYQLTNAPVSPKSKRWKTEDASFFMDADGSSVMNLADLEPRICCCTPKILLKT